MTDPTDSGDGQTRPAWRFPKYWVLAAIVLTVIALAIWLWPGSREDAEDLKWKSKLSRMEYYVTRQQGTEPPYSGDYWDLKDHGTYHCVCCDAPLFSSDQKYESGTGWPSFWAPLDQAEVGERNDYSQFLLRTEVICLRCDAHLGHVFEDGPDPTGLRYCLNSAALRFRKQE